MIQAGTGYSGNRVAEKAAEMAGRAALEKAGITKADTVIFFASSSYRKHYDSLIQKIKEVTGAENVVGASGQGILTDEIEIERKPGVGLLAIAGELNAASFLIPNLQESNLRAGETHFHSALVAILSDIWLEFDHVRALPAFEFLIIMEVHTHSASSATLGILVTFS